MSAMVLGNTTDVRIGDDLEFAPRTVAQDDLRGATGLYAMLLQVQCPDDGDELPARDQIGRTTTDSAECECGDLDPEMMAP
ncbi:hypothetical protein ACFQ6E_33765 [Streptomyces sp. NPDC056462]|uniref:hypothetical protein n=1 Tax=Streptomyces sp. NPDC056462 TaxID=3345826 RepID=UPI003693E5FE